MSQIYRNVRTNRLWVVQGWAKPYVGSDGETYLHARPMGANGKPKGPTRGQRVADIKLEQAP